MVEIVVKKRRFSLSPYLGWRLLVLLEHGGTFGAVPLALGLGGEAHAAEVEPLHRAVEVVTTYHLAVRDLEEQVENKEQENIVKKTESSQVDQEIKTCWQRQ